MRRCISLPNNRRTHRKTSVIDIQRRKIETKQPGSKRLCGRKQGSYQKNPSIHSGEPSSHQLIKILNGFLSIIPAQFEFELAVDPVFCFRENMKTVDGLDASFIHRIIAPE